MKEYYQQRAREYESIYFREDPARQKEQLALAEMLQKFLKGRNILEIASGTGFWTAYLSQTAKEITGTDIAPEVLEIAREKTYKCPVTFKIEDAYHLSFPPETFDGALANFWFSHVPKSRLEEFFANLHRILKKNSAVFIADNTYAPEYGGKLITKKGERDTYKLRTLKDGSEHLILKNYYTPKELETFFKTFDPDFSAKNIFYGKNFWYVTYHLKK